MIIKSCPQNGQNFLSDAQALLLHEQHEAVNEFFRRDSNKEIVNSLNTMIDAFLFTEDNENVKPEMRMHVSNHLLRVITLTTKLGQTTIKW